MNDQLTITIKGTENPNQSIDGDVKPAISGGVTTTYSGTVDSVSFDRYDKNKPEGELTIKVTVPDTATRATDKAMANQIAADLGGEFNVDASYTPHIAYNA